MTHNPYAKMIAKTVAELVAQEGSAVVPLSPTPKGERVARLEGDPFEVDSRGVEKCVKVFMWDRRLEGDKAIVATRDEEGKVWLACGVLEEVAHVVGE